MKTLQELFDIVLTALRAQRVASGRYAEQVSSWKADTPDPSTWECLYRDDHGNKCAAGHVLEDAYYDPRMEGSRVTSASIWFRMRDSGVPDESSARMLMTLLQRAHDECMPRELGGSMVEWEERMRTLAIHHNLTYTEPPMSVKSHRVQQAVQTIVGSAAAEALGAHLRGDPGASMVEQVPRQFELWCNLMAETANYWELRTAVASSLAWLGYEVVT